MNVVAPDQYQRKRFLSVIIFLLIGMFAAGCANTAAAQPDEKTQIRIFLAASLQKVMEQLTEQYRETHPDVVFTCHADSSGTLVTQIREGYACDIFFSAAQKQMDRLEADGLLVPETRADVVRNRVVVITGKNSGTQVTGLLDIGNARSIALAGGSVPVGYYTRQALCSLGVLKRTDDVAAVTARQISDALGGVQISEQDNVSKVLFAVAEGSCEVGTVYVSDVYGYENRLDVLETVGTELTGDVIYPVAGVLQKETDRNRQKAAADFLSYLQSQEAQDIFLQYGYDALR